MNFLFRKFKTNDTDKWESFVKKATNATIFHQRLFLSYHPKDRFIDHSIIIEKGKRWLAVFPAILRINNKGETWLVSHGGASYGGFVYQEGLSFEDSMALVEHLKEYAQAIGVKGIQLTLPPAIYQSRISNYMDFAFVKHGFEYEKRDISSILEAERNPEDNLNKFKATHRTAVRKATKEGVQIRFSDDYDGFYEILKKNLKIRHGVSPTHTIDELKKLVAMYPNDIHLKGAYYNDKLIAGVVNFIANKRVVLAFYISHDESYQHLRGVNLLFYDIINWCGAEGYEYLDFGIFTVNMDPNY